MAKGAMGKYRPPIVNTVIDERFYVISERNGNAPEVFGPLAENVAYETKWALEHNHPELVVRVRRGPPVWYEDERKAY